MNAADAARSGRDRLQSRLLRGACLAGGVLVVTLVIGIVGFLYLADMDFPMAFHEAALLLSGMGPQIVAPLRQDQSRLRPVGNRDQDSGLPRFAVMALDHIAGQQAVRWLPGQRQSDSFDQAHGTNSKKLPSDQMPGGL